MASLVQTLTDIRRQAGVLTPAEVVNASTPEDAPLHQRFEWDDTIAGHRYRLTQASDLIRQAKVQYTDQRGHEKTVRAFIAIREAEPKPADDYMPIRDVVASATLLAQAKAEYLAAFRKLKAQYGHLEEFAQLTMRILDEDGGAA